MPNTKTLFSTRSKTHNKKKYSIRVNELNKNKKYLLVCSNSVKKRKLNSSILVRNRFAPIAIKTKMNKKHKFFLTNEKN